MEEKHYHDLYFSCSKCHKSIKYELKEIHCNDSYFSCGKCKWLIKCKMHATCKDFFNSFLKALYVKYTSVLPSQTVVLVSEKQIMYLSVKLPVYLNIKITQKCAEKIKNNIFLQRFCFLLLIKKVITIFSIINNYHLNLNI